MSEPQAAIQARQNIGVPGCGMDALNKVVTGLYARDPTPTKYSDLATTVKISGPIASSALNLAKDLGLAKTTSGSGRGAYQLTELGKKYGLHLQSKNESGRKSVLREAILGRDEWKEIVFFLRSNPSKAMKTTDLSAHVASQLGRTWKERALDAYGANYANLLSSAGLAAYDRKKGTITSTSEGEVAEASGDEIPTANLRSDTQETDMKIQKDAPKREFSQPFLVPVNINITIEGKDKDGIDGVIRLIQALKGQPEKSQ